MPSLVRANQSVPYAKKQCCCDEQLLLFLTATTCRHVVVVGLGQLDVTTQASQFVLVMIISQVLVCLPGDVTASCHSALCIHAAYLLAAMANEQRR